MFKDMSKAALTLFIYGIYLVIIGFILLIAPEVIFTIIIVISEPDIMSRFLGILVIFLAYYYIRAAFDEEGLEKFFMWTVHTRAIAAIFITIFFILQFVSGFVGIFAAIDIGAALQTYWALREVRSD
ncbi:MAG: hypothetical protein ACFFCV_05175 [Promethearchaeota archaeon]